MVEHRFTPSSDQAVIQMCLLNDRRVGFYGIRYDIGYREASEDYVKKYPDAKERLDVMKRDACMLRLVLGLGTRAVNRVEGDYPRIVALDEPLSRVHTASEDTQRFFQHDADVLNIRENTIFRHTDYVEISRDLVTHYDTNQ